MAKDRPASKLMRVDIETYELLRTLAKVERRHMNAQLAVLVREAISHRLNK